MNMTHKNYFENPMVKNKMLELLGKNAPAFITAVLQIVNGNSALQNCSSQSIFAAACMAATLNLPINNNLGFAYIVPFKGQAQFQLGYKGFIQLAQRSGQFKRINACAIYEYDSEADVYQRLTSFLPKPANGQIIGYVAYFELVNGFVAHLTMTLEQLQSHAKRYSQSYKNGGGVWRDNFEAMAKKTVIKLLLSQQAPLSIDSQLEKAIEADQAVILEDGNYHYPDTQTVQGKMTITDEQMPQILALTQSTSADEIFSRYALSDHQAQQVFEQYQQGANHAHQMQ